MLVRQGGAALVGGRFRECERLAARAAAAAPAEAAPRLLAAVVRREQGRAAEAEVLVRAVAAEHPDSADADALLAAVLTDLGRDGEARRRLDQLVGEPERLDRPGVAALAAETAAALQETAAAEALQAPLAAAAGNADSGGWYGSTERHLGLVCHLLGRWDEAEGHFRRALDANRAAGAPVLLAHTRRDYSALLRARGDDGDWERAVELLAAAAGVYRLLDLGPLADEAEAVLRRSQDPAPAGSGSGVNVLRRVPAGWEVVFDDRRAVVPNLAGVGHLAALLAADGRPVHVSDLVGPTPADAVAAEYRTSLAEVDARLGAAPSTDPALVALARAERDLLEGELAALSGDPGPAPVPAGGAVDRARRLVALRLRHAVDHLDAALPPLGRHLRRSIRSGTFCLYEPEGPARWKIGR